MSWTYNKMGRIIGYVESLVRAMGEAALIHGKPEVCDTAKLEIRSLKRSLGPLVPLLLWQFGVPRLSGRDDLDRLAQGLLNLMSISNTGGWTQPTTRSGCSRNRSFTSRMARG